MPGLLGNIYLPKDLLTKVSYFIFFSIGYTPVNMNKLIVPILVFLLALGTLSVPHTSFAQSANKNSAELSRALSRLKNNPRYYGRILGTHLRRSGKNYVYEVRILRPNDTIIVVCISPKTGGVMGDSERGG